MPLTTPFYHNLLFSYQSFPQNSQKPSFFTPSHYILADFRLKLLQSKSLIGEFEEVINRPKFTFIPEDLKIEFMEILLEVSDIIEPNITLNVIEKDDPDNRVLECAVCGEAKYIISGDEHLLTLKDYAQIMILNASDFLNKES